MGKRCKKVELGKGVKNGMKRCTWRMESRGGGEMGLGAVKKV